MSAGTVPKMQEIAEHRKTWRDLWLNMADGDPVKYKEIKSMDAIKEFWGYYEFWKKKQERLIAQMKQNQANQANQQKRK